jgi:predicted SnoaL-like aldol condensation-catalyzing enzyme
MKAIQWLCAAGALAAMSGALAADLTPILSNGPERTERQEYDNKALGLLFHRTLFSEGDPQLAADWLMDANFINHDIDEASGGQNFADFFLKPTEFNNPTPGRGGAPHAASPAGLQKLYVVTDGDLTMMAYVGRGAADPGARFGSNMFETKHGRVTAWWYSGPTAMAGAAAPPTAATPPAAGAVAPGGARAGGAPAAQNPNAVATDYSGLYGPAGPTVVSMQTVIDPGKATRAERDANKKLVGAFFDEFFNQKSDAAAAKYLSVDIKSHVADSPSGSGFAQYARSNAAKVTAPRTDTVLFLLAEGELVDIGWPYVINGDPGAWYGQNLLRVKNGRIVEWWFSGYPNGTPRKVNPWNKLGYSPRAEALINAGKQP